MLKGYNNVSPFESIVNMASEMRLEDETALNKICFEYKNRICFNHQIFYVNGFVENEIK